MPVIRLHKRATTTPEIRRIIQTSDLPSAQLARQLGVTEATVRKWRNRDGVQDHSHARHTRICSLSELEEYLAVELRLRLRLSTADILEVMSRCMKSVFSSSSLYRTLKRNEVSKLPPAREARSWKPFDVESEPGFLHVDVKHLTKLEGKRTCVYAGIDRATRYVHVEIHDNLRPATAAGFVGRLAEHLGDLGIEVRTILSDNGPEWTDRFAEGRDSTPTGRHAVDQECARRGIEHRLSRARRLSWLISEAQAQAEKTKDDSGQNCFSSHKERNEFLLNMVHSYNHTRLVCLGYKTPLEMMDK